MKMQIKGNDREWYISLTGDLNRSYDLSSLPIKISNISTADGKLELETQQYKSMQGAKDALRRMKNEKF